MSNNVRDALVKAFNLSKYYRVSLSMFKKTLLKAVDNVNLTINEGEVLGLLGESGSGKTTLGKMLVALEEPTSGKILFNNEDLKEYVRKRRIDIQMVFQNPDTSLNPRMRVGEVLQEALEASNFNGDYSDEVERLLNDVGLDSTYKHYYPHQLSGGQKQRVAIARALAVKPKFLVADEIVSALDASVKTQILKLVIKLQKIYRFSMLFISHDLPTTVYVSDRISVMYSGKIVEEATKEELIKDPLHPYTRHLIASIPSLYSSLFNGKAQKLKDVSNGLQATTSVGGCKLFPRCPYATEICKALEPPEVSVSKTHKVFCHMYVR